MCDNSRVSPSGGLDGWCIAVGVCEIVGGSGLLGGVGRRRTAVGVGGGGGGGGRRALGVGGRVAEEVLELVAARASARLAARAERSARAASSRTRPRVEVELGVGLEVGDVQLFARRQVGRAVQVLRREDGALGRQQRVDRLLH